MQPSFIIKNHLSRWSTSSLDRLMKRCTQLISCCSVVRLKKISPEAILIESISHLDTCHHQLPSCATGDSIWLIRPMHVVPGASI